MRRRTLLFLLVPIVLAVLFVAARIAAAPLLGPALGFAAKVTCSGVLVGGATAGQVRASFPDERLRSVVRVRVDSAAGTAHASVPLLGRRRALHRPGLGCTLVPVRGEVAPIPPPSWPPLAAAAWPGAGDSAVAGVAIDVPRLRAVVDSAFAEVPGESSPGTLAVVVVHAGSIVVERYAAGYTSEHRFPGWSMAKSVTSALVGILAGDGRIDLDAAGLREEWRGDERNRITLGQLMHMSSGLEFDESYAPTGGATRMLFHAEDAAEVAATSPLAYAPGTRWSYSSGTTNLISRHVRERFDDDGAYTSFAAQRLFGPIGMHSAVFEPDPSGTLVGSSFLYATARDWARFGLLYLWDGVWAGVRILPEGWVRYSARPAAAAPLGRYGAQWWLNAGEVADTARRPWPDLPRDILFASGFQGQYVVVVPSRDLVVVRLGMAESGAFRLGPFLRSVLAALDAAASMPSAPPAAPVRTPASR